MRANNQKVRTFTYGPDDTPETVFARECNPAPGKAGEGARHLEAYWLDRYGRLPRPGEKVEVPSAEQLAAYVKQARTSTQNRKRRMGEHRQRVALGKNVGRDAMAKPSSGGVKAGARVVSREEQGDRTAPVLEQLVALSPEPPSRLNPALWLSLPAVYSDLLNGSELQRLLASRTGAELRDLLLVAVRRRWPSLDGGDAAGAAEAIVELLDTFMPTVVGHKLCQLVRAALQQSAFDLRLLAGDRDAVERLVVVIHRLEKTTTGDAAVASELQLGLGWEGLDLDVKDPAPLQEALSARAALLVQEADALATLAPQHLAERMAPLTGAHHAFRSALGMSDGSYLATRLEALVRRGERDVALGYWSKVAASIVAGTVVGALTAGAGAAVAISAAGASSAITNAPGIAKANERVRQMMALETSGAAPAGSVDAARGDLNEARWAMAADVVLPSPAAHGLARAQRLFDHEAFEVLLENAADLAIDAVEFAAHSHGSDVRDSAPRRAILEAALTRLGELEGHEIDALGAALSAVFDDLDVRDRKTRDALLAGFLIDTPDMRRVGPAGAAILLRDWLQKRLQPRA